LKRRVGGALEPFRWRYNSLTTAGIWPRTVKSVA
jgi:hypothetical protein